MMEKIDWKFITEEGGDQNNIIVPMALDYNCPYCDRIIHFKMGWTGTPYETYVCKAYCSGCKNFPKFIYVVNERNEGKPRKGDLFINPSSKKRKPFLELNQIEKLSKQLVEEYEIAIRVFNHQEWIPASVMCRRILEGLLQQLLPPDEIRKQLHQQILALDQHNDLKKPIKDIADVLRIAGNKGAHFDLENRPTRETLELMFDLIDYLLEYFFVLPAKTDALRNHVVKLTSKDQ
jgi:hypothetical protein